MNPHILRCLVVDDEDLAVALLARYIEQSPGLRLVGSCENAIQARQVLASGAVDVLFLDIELPQRSGLQLLEELGERRPAAVILTTSYAEFAVEGFRLSVLDYLLKPFPFERFQQAVAKIGAPLVRPAAEYLTVRAGAQFVRVALDAILYVQGLKQYIKIVTEGKTYVVLDSLKAIESQLPPARFARIHKSYIVALAKLQAYGSRAVEINGRRLPVGRRYGAPHPAGAEPPTSPA